VEREGTPSPFPPFLAEVNRWLEGGVAFLTGFGIGGGVGLAFLNVVARFVFNVGLDWAFEVTKYLFIWSAFFGAVLCFREGCHIRVTLLLDLLPPKLRKWVQVVGDIVVLLYLGVVTYFSYIFIFDPDLGVKASGEINVDVGIPMWIPYLILPIAGVLGGYFGVLHLIETLMTPPEELGRLDREMEELLEEYGGE
jgi:C4-dicarboxylate transporter DctQ subunit